MTDAGMRRIVVGVDGSAESAAALRWACREASLRGALVHAVHVREACCHSLASYAVPGYFSQSESDAGATDPVEEMWQSVLLDQPADVQVRAEVVEGLAARVLLDRSAGADMLVLGTAADQAGALRSPGPVIRACLRRAPCPVVAISAALDPMASREPPAWPAVDVPAPVGRPAGVATGAVPAGAGV